MQTILITGASSGIGKATAIYFADRGWNVAATMRNPESTANLREYRNLKKYQLDVQNEESIKKAIESAIKDFGKIDVLLNNAGYAAVGPLEYATSDQVKKQFQVNVFGLLNTTKQILPHFRANKSGRIINISSMGERITFPYFSLYHATKFAVEGVSESLNYELNPLGIDVIIIEPGSVQTEYTGRSMNWFEGDIKEYNAAVNNLKSKIENAHITRQQIPNKPEDIAEVIYKAAIAKNSRMRYVVGKDAKMILMIRKILGVSRTMGLIKRMYKI